MKNININSYLNQCLEKYQAFIGKNIYFSAYAELGQIWAVLNSSQVTEKLKSKYYDIIDEQIQNNEQNHKVKVECKKRYEKLIQIITIGERFVEEEILQIMTIRLQLNLVINLFKSQKIEIENFNIENVDTIIKKIAHSNYKEYNHTIVRLKKNWPLVVKMWTGD